MAMTIKTTRIVIDYKANGANGPGVYYKLEEVLPGEVAIIHDTCGPFPTPRLAIADLARTKAGLIVEQAGD